MLDYDKRFLLESLGNLTFDGSPIHYFPADVIGAGKVIFFACVLNGDRTPYHSDFRSMLNRIRRISRKSRVLPRMLPTK